MSLKARRVVRRAGGGVAGRAGLPARRLARAGRASRDRRATAATVRDYIAGMTDRYALDEHDRLFKLSRERA